MKERSTMLTTPLQMIRQDSPTVFVDNGMVGRYHLASGSLQGVITTSKIGGIRTPWVKNQYTKGTYKQTYHHPYMNRHRYTKETLRTPPSNTMYRFISSSYPQYHLNGGHSWPIVKASGDRSLERRVFEKAKSKFYSQIRSNQFDAMITLAEGSKTAVMINNRRKLLFSVRAFAREFWKRIRGRSIRQHESIAKAMANVWLEMIYGWRQLANDIYALSIATRSEMIERRVKVRASVMEVSSFREQWAVNGLKVYCNQTLSARCELSINLQVTNSVMFDISRFASLNPAAIAWEMMPFSFVFDWIYNVSNYLSNLQTSMMFGSHFVDGYKTLVFYNTIDGSIPQGSTRGTQQELTFKQHYSYYSKWVFKDRSPLTAFPLPGLPTLGGSVSAEKALTTLSLIVQRLKDSHLGRTGRYM